MIRSYGAIAQEANQTCLLALARTPRWAYSRLELLQRIRGAASEGYDRTVDVHVKNTRIKNEPDLRTPRCTVTSYGAGYRFAVERPHLLNGESGCIA